MPIMCCMVYYYFVLVVMLCSYEWKVTGSNLDGLVEG